jgi:hypothetical protein
MHAMMPSSCNKICVSQTVDNCLTLTARAGVYWLLKRCDPRLLSRQVRIAYFSDAYREEPTKTSGVGLQLVCHAADAQCDQRKLRLVRLQLSEAKLIRPAARYA